MLFLMNIEWYISRLAKDRMYRAFELRKHFPHDLAEEHAEIFVIHRFFKLVKTEANASGSRSWTIMSTASSVGSSAFHFSETIFASSWKSWNENTFCSQNLRFFPKVGFFFLKMVRDGLSLLSKIANFALTLLISCVWRAWKQNDAAIARESSYVEVLRQNLWILQAYRFALLLEGWIRFHKTEFNIFHNFANYNRNVKVFPKNHSFTI